MADELFPDRKVLTTTNCPNGHPIKITYGQARKKAEVTCAVCGAKIQITGDMDRELRAAERAYASLQDTIKKFGR